MRYWKQRWKQLLPCGITFAAFNLYFFFFIQNKKVGYLGYLDVLLVAPGLMLMVADGWQLQKKEDQKLRLMKQKELISRTIDPFENQDIAEHDIQILEEQAQIQFQENCELQDYVAKWCHELKLPLSAALLINEKITDKNLKMSMREPLEKMSLQINSLLLGCKLQSPLFDLQVKRVLLLECVKTSIHNNQFFLIQKGFCLHVEVEPLTVYTDPAWLVYILDQLFSNALKYSREQAESSSLHLWTTQEGKTVKLFVEDNGEGIKDCDIRRIFEKGFTGSSYHNGKYKSTGMGLYMVSKIADRLGHEIHVESEYCHYTRFCIIFHIG